MIPSPHAADVASSAFTWPIMRKRIAIFICYHSLRVFSPAVGKCPWLMAVRQIFTCSLEGLMRMNQRKQPFFCSNLLYEKKEGRKEGRKEVHESITYYCLLDGVVMCSMWEPSNCVSLPHLLPRPSGLNPIPLGATMTGELPPKRIWLTSALSSS